MIMCAYSVFFLPFIIIIFDLSPQHMHYILFSYISNDAISSTIHAAIRSQQEIVMNSVFMMLPCSATQIILCMHTF